MRFRTPKILPCARARGNLLENARAGLVLDLSYRGRCERKAGELEATLALRWCGAQGALARGLPGTFRSAIPGPAVRISVAAMTPIRLARARGAPCRLAGDQRRPQRLAWAFDGNAGGESSAFGQCESFRRNLCLHDDSLLMAKLSSPASSRPGARAMSIAHRNGPQQQVDLGESAYARAWSSPPRCHLARNEVPRGLIPLRDAAVRTARASMMPRVAQRPVPTMSRHVMRVVIRAVDIVSVRAVVISMARVIPMMSVICRGWQRQSEQKQRSDCNILHASSLPKISYTCRNSRTRAAHSTTTSNIVGSVSLSRWNLPLLLAGRNFLTTTRPSASPQTQTWPCKLSSGGSRRSS